MSPLRIARVEARALDLPLVEPFAIATGAQHCANNVVVSVELEGGARGLGEAAPFPAVSGETQARTLAALGELGPRLVGRGAGEWRALSHEARLAAAEEPAARAALEMAVLDALARAAALPLSALYGGCGSSLCTDVTITAGDLAHARRSAAAFAGRGFRTLKIKVGAGSHAEDAERVAAVAEAAPGARLVLDANGGYDEPAALGLLAELARRGVAIGLFEQPLPPGDPGALARLRAKASVPLFADESARSARDVLALAKAGAVDGVNVKLMKTGIVEALAIVEIAKAADLALMIGGMVESEIAMLHSAHFASGLGGFSEVDLDTPLFLERGSTVEGYPLDADRLLLDPSRAGIGRSLAPPSAG